MKKEQRPLTRPRGEGLSQDAKDGFAKLIAAVLVIAFVAWCAQQPTDWTYHSDNKDVPAAAPRVYDGLDVEAAGCNHKLEDPAAEARWEKTCMEMGDQDARDAAAALDSQGYWDR